MRSDPLELFLERLGYRFRDLGLLEAALTHRSFVNESLGARIPDNERLEFLGDAVIDLVVSAELMRRFPEAREGQLSRMRASMVSAPGLARMARKLGLGEVLRVGRGEELSGGRSRSSLLADAFEAVFAAVYLDAGFDGVRAVLVGVLDFPPEGAVGQGDPKTELQERLQAKLRQTPSYRLVSERGPDHEKTFTAEILLGAEKLAEGAGRSKKEAEQAAARAALRDLAARGELDD